MNYGDHDYDITLTVWKDKATPFFQIPLYDISNANAYGQFSRLEVIDKGQRHMLFLFEAIRLSKALGVAIPAVHPALAFLISAVRESTEFGLVTVDLMRGRPDLALQFEKVKIERIHLDYPTTIGSTYVYYMTLRAKAADFIVGRWYGRHLNHINKWRSG